MALFNFFKKNKNINEEPSDESIPSEEDQPTDNERPSEAIDDEAPEATYEESEAEPGDALITENMAWEDEDAAGFLSEAAPEELDESPPVDQKKGFFSKILSGLDKTRKNIMGNVESVLKSFTRIDEDLYEELEEALIAADIGVATAINLIDRLRQRVKTDKIHDVEQVRIVLTEEITAMLAEDSNDLILKSPSIILVIGVNGVGKTTTIGKLAANLKAQGKSVLLAAADTFRAAAIDQLEIWGSRSNIPVIKHQENSDPGAVVFDAVQAAKARKADVLICDTAGRLHNKKNLMEELRKIGRIIEREYAEAQLEIFIVLDATTGQNALQQAATFKEICPITGIVLTKLDGTAKGGIIIAIKNELKIPIRFIGVGESIDDLQPFDPEQFARALFSEV